MSAELDALTDSLELVSQRYARIFDIRRDPAWFLLKLQEETGELTQAYLAVTGQARAKGRSAPELRESFENEVADVLAHVLLLARHHDVDVDAVMQRKWLSRLPSTSDPASGQTSDLPSAPTSASAE